GSLGEARAHIERNLAICREIGYRAGEANAQGNLGFVLRAMGDAAGSEERYLACLDVYDEIGERRGAAHAHVYLGSLRSSVGAVESARASLVAARDLAKALDIPNDETLARCELSVLPGGEASDAVSAFTAHQGELRLDECREARLLLWRATGDRTHISEAKRLLDEALAKVPAEYHAAMLANVRVNREIAAAAEEQGL
ncbi:MAG: hypothetical protein K8T90_18825, partial [Planctomycetes bacterium]|nr:hypothetical protein [Planctomycetota bacterium]